MRSNCSTSFLSLVIPCKPYRVLPTSCWAALNGSWHDLLHWIHHQRRQQQLLAALPSCCRCSFSASCRREHCPLPDHSLAPAMIAPDPLMQITTAALPFCCWSLEWLRFCLFTVGFHGTRLFQPWIVFHVTVHTPGVPITNREVNSHFTVEVRIKSFQSI